jgi:glycosyltransferase involved in cell wall biosynthesis
MRILFVLPGLHRYNRGAEVAFVSVARELARSGDKVTLIGSGENDLTAPYRFIRARSLPRECFDSFPFMPIFRHEYAYEEFTFLPELIYKFRPSDFDVTLTCSYPFTNWALRRPVLFGHRPPHVFVTQNGDWPAIAKNSEYRFFGCDGLVCINPDYFDRNKEKWRCRLIPNGVDCNRFQAGPSERQSFGLPVNRSIVLMVSALIESKRVLDGIKSASLVPHTHLVVAGDGPLRDEVEAAAANLLPNRFTRLSITPDRMPSLYRSADLFLHLSKDEPFGNVFLEALASGLPIVAPNSSRLRWIVGEDEFLVDNDDPIGIASAIKAALDLPKIYRPEKQKRAMSFSWPNIAARYRDFLQEVINSSERSERLSVL